MKVIIDATVLKSSLKKVAEIVNWKNPLPILQGIYFHCSEEGIQLKASDGDNIVTRWLPIEDISVIEPGTVIIPEQAYRLILKLTGEITIEAEEKLKIHYGKKSQVSLSTMNFEEYPRIPNVDINVPSLTLKGEEFNDLIRKTIISASRSDTRPILQGIKLEAGEEKVTWVSTDSYRLSQVTINKKVEGDIEAVIPAKTFKSIQKLDLKGDLSFYVNNKVNNNIVIKNEQMLFFVRKLDGQYPNTSRLIPYDFQTEIKMSRMELLDALERMKPISESTENNKGVLIFKVADGNSIELSTEHNEMGQCTEFLEYQEKKGENIELAFSLQYFRDALSVIDSNDIWIKFTGELRPFVVVPDSSDYEEIQLLLPVRRG